MRSNPRRTPTTPPPLRLITPQAGEVFEDTGVTYLTELEASKGSKHEWIGLNQAITKIEDSVPTSESGRSIKERDLFFLTEYRKTRPLPFMFLGAKVDYNLYETFTYHCIFVILYNKSHGGIVMIYEAPYYKLHPASSEHGILHLN